jgi:hypothetical protein
MEAEEALEECDGGKENVPQQASRERGERGGSRQASAVAEDEEDEAAVGSGGGGSGGQAALRRPPVLFQPDDPSLMTQAQKKGAGLQVERSIHVCGGKGKNEVEDGKATVKLAPGVNGQGGRGHSCARA